MKLLKSLAAIAALGLALLLPAAAQSYTLPVTVANNFAATTTNTLTTSTIDLTRYRIFVWQPVFNLTGSGTSACVFTLQKSADNVNWIADSTLSITANGTNTVTSGALVTADAWPYWQISQITNPNANGITNLVITVNVKRAIKEYGAVN